MSGKTRGDRNAKARERLRTLRKSEETKKATLSLPPDQNKNWVWHPEEWVSWLSRDPKSALDRFQKDYPGTRGDTASIGFVRRLTEAFFEDESALEERTDFLMDGLVWRRTLPMASHGSVHSPEARFVSKDQPFGMDLALVNAGPTIPAFKELGRETTAHVSRVCHSPDAFDDFATQSIKFALKQFQLDVPEWLPATVVLALSYLKSSERSLHLDDFPLRWKPKTNEEDLTGQIYFEAEASNGLDNLQSLSWLRVVREYSLAVFDGACPGAKTPIYHAFFSNLSRLRTGCRANVALTVRKNVLSLVSLRPIEPDEELIWSPWQIATLGVRRSHLPELPVCSSSWLDDLVEPRSKAFYLNPLVPEFASCESCILSISPSQVRQRLRKKFMNYWTNDSLKMAAFVCRTREEGLSDNLFNSACMEIVKDCRRGRLTAGKYPYMSQLQLTFGGPRPHRSYEEEGPEDDDELVARWESDVVTFLWLDFGDLLIRKLGTIASPECDPQPKRNCLREIAELLIQSISHSRPILPLESDMSLRLFLALINTCCYLDEALPPSGLFHMDIAHELQAFVIAWRYSAVSVAVDLEKVELLHRWSKRAESKLDSTIEPFVIPPLCFVTIPILRVTCDRVMQQFRREIYPPMAFRRLAEMLAQPPKSLLPTGFLSTEDIVDTKGDHSLSEQYILGLEKLDDALASPSDYFTFDRKTAKFPSLFALAMIYWHDYDRRRELPSFDTPAEMRHELAGICLPLQRILHAIAFHTSPLSKFKAHNLT